MCGLTTNRSAVPGPLLIRAGEVSGYWGDLHGQSGESIGVTTSRQYFDFARNKSFLDVTGHQANDFQVNNAFWAYLNELTDEYQETGRFVTFPGYEWSGNTAVGGDRNVFFRTEGRQIHRSSHALLPDRSDLDTDASDANALFGALKDEDCVVYAHVGGRYADIAYAHDPRLETAMEIHSAWGTFEWMLTDGFPLGHRCGVVCNSGRPQGASRGELSRRRDIWRVWGPDLLLHLGTKSRWHLFVFAKTPPLRHHRLPVASRSQCARARRRSPFRP